MFQALTHRLRFWKEALLRPWRLLMLFLWTLFSSAATIRDNFFSSELQQQWSTLKLMPHWGWQVWAIGMLVILLCVAMEGAYQKWEREHRQVETLSEQLRSVEKASLSSSLFMVQHTEHELGVREQNGGFGWLDPKVRPKSGTLMLQVEVSIDAIPARLVESIELVVMGRRIQSNWESREVHSVRQRFICFDIPSWMNSGPHTVNLVARDSKNEVFSPEFEISIPQQA